MRILLVVDCYFPTTKSAPMHMHDLGLELQQLGHDVTILVPSETVAGEFQVTEEDGLCILRVRTGRLKGAHRVLRGLREARLASTLWSRGRNYLRSHPADLIVFYSPSIFFGPFIQRLKQLWHCPVYLVLRDIWPQFLLDIGAMRPGPVYSYFLKRAKEEYDCADFIGVQSPNDIDFFNSEYLGHRHRLEVLQNWISLDDSPLPPCNWRQQLGLQDKVVFFYGGNFGMAQDLENVLRLAKALEDQPEIFFLFVGSGSEEGTLQAGIKSLALSNVRILPPVGPHEFAAMVSEFDVGLISLHPNFRVQNIPGKLMSYLYFSKPVLASVNPGNDLLRIIPDNSAGFSCINGRDDILRESALALASDPRLRERFGGNGRKLLERDFSVRAVAQQILSHFAQRPVERAPAETHFAGDHR